MRILFLAMSIAPLCQVWGNTKHFLLETKDDLEEPIETKDDIAKNEADSSHELANDMIEAYQGGIIDILVCFPIIVQIYKQK